MEKKQKSIRGKPVAIPQLPLANVARNHRQMPLGLGALHRSSASPRLSLTESQQSLCSGPSTFATLSGLLKASHRNLAVLTSRPLRARSVP
jgi:hypothetical protein